MTRPNQVWATDITYVPLQGGYAYLCAVIDWHSRCVLAWELSNTLDASFCARAVQRALAAHGFQSEVRMSPALFLAMRRPYQTARTKTVLLGTIFLCSQAKARIPARTGSPG